MEASLIGGNQASRHGYCPEPASLSARSEADTLCPRSLELQGTAGVAEMARSLSKYPLFSSSSPKTNHIYGRQESFLCPSPPPDHLDVDSSSTNNNSISTSTNTNSNNSGTSSRSSSLTDPPSSTPAAASYTCAPPISPPLDPGDVVIQNGSMAASFDTPSARFPSTPLILESQAPSSSTSSHYCAQMLDACRSSHHPLLSSSTMDHHNQHHQFQSPSPFSQSSMMEDGYASSDLHSDQHSTSGSQKNEEPYAQLIYKAFMSRPGHCMSLQDIYQWFRDNTKKATSEKGGWQNSIRHNLSMNAAFTKREKQPQDGCSPRSEAKRSTEWVLEAWAVADGVQSTTRYRKGTGGSGRRCSGKQQQSDDHLEYGRRSSRSVLNASRAQSGRKGGCAASSRHGRRGNRKYGEHLELTPPTHPTLTLEHHQQPRTAPSSLHDYDADNSQMGDFHASSSGLPTNMTPRKYESMRGGGGGPDSMGYPATTPWDVYPSAAYYSHHQHQHQQHQQHQAMPYSFHGRMVPDVQQQHVLYSDGDPHHPTGQQQQQQHQPPFAPEPLFSNMHDAMCDLSRTGV